MDFGEFKVETPRIESRNAGSLISNLPSVEKNLESGRANGPISVFGPPATMSDPCQKLPSPKATDFLRCAPEQSGRAEEPVAGVAQARQDVTPLVQAPVNGGGVNGQMRELLVDAPYPLRVMP